MCILQHALEPRNRRTVFASSLWGPQRSHLGSETLLAREAVQTVVYSVAEHIKWCKRDRLDRVVATQPGSNYAAVHICRFVARDGHLSFRDSTAVIPGAFVVSAIIWLVEKQAIHRLAHVLPGKAVSVLSPQKVYVRLERYSVQSALRIA